MKNSLIILILFFTYQIGIAQNNSDTINLNGTIGNHFHLSSSHNIQEDKRAMYLVQIDSLSDKIAILDKYYTLQNDGKNKEADDLLESDSTLSKMNAFGISMLYMMKKMQDLDILFLPLIQCSNSDLLISCDLEQLTELEDYLNSDKEVQLTCVYITSIPLDRTEIVKLIKIDR